MGVSCLVLGKESSQEEFEETHDKMGGGGVVIRVIVLVCFLGYTSCRTQRRAAATHLGRIFSEVLQSPGRSAGEDEYDDDDVVPV